VIRLTKVNTCRYLCCSAAEHTYKDPGACYVVGSNRFLLCLLFTFGPPLPPHLILHSQARFHRRVQLNDSKTGIISHFRSPLRFLSGESFVRSFITRVEPPITATVEFAVLGLLHQTAIFASRRGWVDEGVGIAELYPAVTRLTQRRSPHYARIHPRSPSRFCDTEVYTVRGISEALWWWMLSENASVIPTARNCL